MEGRPTFRGSVRALWWLIGNQDERRFKAMGCVRRELMRVVFSRASDPEAADAIRDVVASDPRGARATLSHVERAREFSGTYISDRAYRVLVAAMHDSKPEPVDPAHAALFERERELGWMPLDQAFSELRSLCPELDAVRLRAEQLSGSAEARAARSTERLVVQGDLLSEALGDADRLVGPESKNPDPLVRSAFASQLVSSYAAAVLTGSDAGATECPLWDPSGPQPHVVFSSRCASSVRLMSEAKP